VYVTTIGRRRRQKGKKKNQELQVQDEDLSEVKVVAMKAEEQMLAAKASTKVEDSCDDQETDCMRTLHPVRCDTLFK
jgi:hypothetical protein